jgi:sugar phosphate isomerase/epimerase
MKVRDVGICLNTNGQSITLAELETTLDGFKRSGFRLAEVDPSLFALIINGEVRRGQLDGFLAVTRRSGLRLTVHGPGRLNLAFDPRHDLCKRVMAAYIELCGLMGADRLVYHSGLQALDLVRTGVRSTLLSARELAEGAAREVAALRELAPRAADAGVVICMENLDPHLWELAMVRGFGLPDSALDDHLARLRIGPIVRQLEAVGHPSVGMTLDLGHLWLSAHQCGFPYLEAVSEAAPWVRHLHATDNFGRLDVGYATEHERWAYGEADMHLPPGWGSVPFRDAFARLPGFQGDLILEILAELREHVAEARTSVVELLG